MQPATGFHVASVHSIAERAAIDQRSFAGPAGDPPQKVLKNIASSAVGNSRIADFVARAADLLFKTPNL